jgi:hypothetical protein
MDSITTIAAAVMGALAKAGGWALRQWKDGRARRACAALLARNPRGAGLVFHIEPEDLEAARWGERQGLLGITKSFDGWSIFRK